ncbi:MAG: biotin transporter BioY [Pseudomonadota bacterium]
MTSLTRKVSHPVLGDLLAGDGAAIWLKRAALVLVGIAALAIAAKIKVPLWPSPVPVTLGTFAVLTIGAAYGPGLGLATILGYLLIGAAGADVFASSSAEYNGLAYMLAGSGGYLAGYVLATLALGVFARMAWDRNVPRMALGLLLGNALIYVPGLLWLQHWIATEGRFDATAYGSIWEQTLAWGLTPFLVGDALKLALAALLLPAVWALVGRARG